MFDDQSAPACNAVLYWHVPPIGSLQSTLNHCLLLIVQSSSFLPTRHCSLGHLVTCLLTLGPVVPLTPSSPHNAVTGSFSRVRQGLNLLCDYTHSFGENSSTNLFSFVFPARLTGKHRNSVLFCSSPGLHNRIFLSYWIYCYTGSREHESITIPIASSSKSCFSFQIYPVIASFCQSRWQLTYQRGQMDFGLTSALVYELKFLFHKNQIILCQLETVHLWIVKGGCLQTEYQFYCNLFLKIV